MKKIFFGIKTLFVILLLLSCSGEDGQTSTDTELAGQWQIISRIQSRGDEQILEGDCNSKKVLTFNKNATGSITNFSPVRVGEVTNCSESNLIAFSFIINGSQFERILENMDNDFGVSNTGRITIDGDRLTIFFDNGVAEIYKKIEE